MVNKSQLRSIFDGSKYKVELFKRENFIRKKCTVCDGHYWTLENDSITCGDTSCVGSYQFIGKPGVNWSLVGGIMGGLAVIITAIYLLLLKKRAAASMHN